MSSQNTTWKKSRYPNIYLHKSGTYYVRISFGSKHSWRSLKTNLLRVAVSEADRIIGEIRLENELDDVPDILQKTNVRVGDLAKLRLQEIENDISIKPATRHYWTQIYKALFASWPGLEETPVRKITSVDCQKWAKEYSAKISATRFNNTLSGLGKLFDIAIDNGVRHSNPLAKIKRLKPSQKDLDFILPSKGQFREWIEEIRNGCGRFSKHSANFVEFLAYSGMRKGEAKFVRWKDCDFVTKQIIVRGDPTTATKNGEIRRIPMINNMVDLLERIRAIGIQTDADDFVCQVNEAQKSMDRAAEKIGMERITHHDLRHLFATTCIEANVDIPTVSRWLGHKDGGALCMKIYGHLRNEHSTRQALKVEF